MSDHQNFSVFPCLSSKEEVLAFINHHIPLRDFYVNLSDHLQRIVLDFFLAKRGSRVTYDSVFKKLFDPALHPDRLEALLSIREFSREKPGCMKTYLSALTVSVLSYIL